MEYITSKSNRWIKLAIQLKQKKYRDKNNMFLMEGLRNVNDAQMQGIEDVICLIQTEKMKAEILNSIMERGLELHWLFCAIKEPLMRLISGTENGQGIVLLVHKPIVNNHQLLEALSGKYVLLDTVQDPGNMGTIIRTAAAAGCSGILLTKGCADPYSEKVVRGSMGSVLRIPIYEELDIIFLKKIKAESRIPFIGTSLRESEDYRKAKFTSEGVFIFGNEGNGVRKEILEIADWNIYIPMSGTVESLNISSAAAIILFHYFVG